MLGKFRFTFFFLILMFSYSNFIIYDFFSLSYKPESGEEFILNTLG
jgi:zona occludens toxin (predicted ATPase)